MKTLFLRLMLITMPGIIFAQEPCSLENYSSAYVLNANDYPYYSAGSGITVDVVLNKAVIYPSQNSSCMGKKFNTPTPSFGLNAPNQSITLNFSAPVSSFSIIVNGVGTGEEFYFSSDIGTISLSNFCSPVFDTINGGKDLRCILKRKINLGTLITINNSIGSTTYTLTHNGHKYGAAYALLDCFVTTSPTGTPNVIAEPTDTIGKNGSRPVFKNGEAQIVPEFNSEDEWIKEELWVETTFDSDYDGNPDRMHVFVTRPKQTASGNLKLPVIYTSSPYNGLKISTLLRQAIKPFSKKLFWNVKHELGETPKKHRHPKLKTRIKRPLFSSYMDKTWVPRGYIMVYSSSPGTGLSDGAITIGGENESLAPKAVIDWLCGRAKGYKTRNGNEEVHAFWSTGKVGMTGTSYDGTICLAAATTGVEGLEAIIPIAPVSSFYHYYRSNGLVRSPGGYLGEDVDVLYDLINTGKKSNRKHNNTVIRDSLLVKYHDRVTGDYNDFWDERDYVNKIDNMHAAMLMAHGFNDWNVMPEQSYRFYKAAKENGLPVQLYYHQDGHGGDPPLKMMNRWFTRYLHGIENDVENDPPVWIVRENNYYPIPYSSFPDSNASNVILHLESGSNGIGHLCTEKPDKQKTETLLDDYSINYSNLYENKNAKHRLLYISPVLEKGIRISGIPRITIRLACNKPAANLSVYLITLPWEEDKHNKHANIINRAWADPQNHNSIRKGEPLVPGEFVELTFNLMPDDQVIPMGKQIGL